MKSGDKAEAAVYGKMVSAKPQTIRRLNRAAVLELIRQHQPLSRADLARHTGIHRSNISLVVEGLRATGLLREERAKGAGRGRVPTLISLNRASPAVLGISVRLQRTTVALAALDAHVESTYTFVTPKTPEEFVDCLEDAVRMVVHNLDEPKATARTVSQIVVSVPGIVDRRPGNQSILWTPGLPAYSGCNLGAMIEKRLAIPCVVANNAGLGAVAALRSVGSKQEDVSDFIFLVVGDFGVGSGVIIHRSLYSGYDAAYAGEVGHTVIDPNGPLCSCGRRGCWQLYICDSATWKRYKPRVDFTAARFEGFLADVNAGVPKALAAIGPTAEYLGMGISNIALTLNPERIVLAGAITRVWPVLEKALKSTFFLPYHQALIQPTSSPLDSLFLKGAIDGAVDILLSNAAGRGRSPGPVNRRINRV